MSDQRSDLCVSVMITYGSMAISNSVTYAKPGTGETKHSEAELPQAIKEAFKILGVRLSDMASAAFPQAAQETTPQGGQR